MNTNNPTIKLLISYHDKHCLLKSDILTPIQTGCALAAERFEGMLQDDDGENISTGNPQYNELTAQYWAWKNYAMLGNPDYIGFMHYRRHFCFDESLIGQQSTWLSASCVYKMPSATDDYLNRNFHPQKISNSLKGYDCLVLKAYDVTNLGSSSNRHHYATGIPEQNVATFDLLLETVLKFFPNYEEEVNSLKNGSEQYLCNMFIMKKDLFFQYCQFLFTVLAEMAKQVDSSHFTSQQNRFLGYMGEYLLSLFIKHAYRTHSFRIKEINGFFIEDIGCSYDIKPVYKTPFSAIVMACSREYIPYLSVCLQSLVEHAHISSNYDIVVMERDIPAEEKGRLKKQIERKNVSLRFLTVPDLLADKQKIKIKQLPESYYRLFAPLLLQGYERIIYTDCDVIFNDDIAKLDQISCPTAIAACRDVMMNARLGLTWADWKRYCREDLDLKNVYDYCNAGVIVVNVAQYIKENIAFKVLKLLTSKAFRGSVQDALNSIVKNEITYLDPAWNWPTLQMHMKRMQFLSAMDCHTLNLYTHVRQLPRIIHYASFRKPWYYLQEDMAEIWWGYARKTPYYEEICLRLNQHETSKIFSCRYKNRHQNYALLYLSYLYYKLMTHITSGEKQAHYKTAWVEAKNEVELWREHS